MVPKIATSASTEAGAGWKPGISPAATWDQSTSTTNSSSTYAKIKSASQRRISE